ncbi:molybdenum cofactor guanylyltransferase [Altericista sp. CCNU0014]|uniref:molybdenum cofactor guanylyltransferase n=1 Tax=Altericista sp. CCNU0014 TaxID=3082949 RepID=UPI00384AE2DA
MGSAIAPSRQVTASILAGGRSRRMGSDKALATWQGVPLLQRVFATAQACCTDVFVVTPWPERYRTLLPRSVRWLVEPPTFAGPMAALALAMESAQTPWVLLLACDLPQLDETVLQRWIQALPDAGIARVPYHQNRWEPLCGFYRADGLPSLQAYLVRNGDRASFQQWLQVVGATPLAVDAAIAPMFHNCNSPDDLALN